MEWWKYFAVAERDHLFCNPMSSEKFDELISLLDLPPGARVLDIACGKGEFLIRLAERYGITGTGVDLSPAFIREARARARQRTPRADLSFLEADGAAFPGKPGDYDLAACLGASWIFGGHRGTLQALARWARPGGLVLAGEPFWQREPAPEYLAAAGLAADSFATHAGNVAAGVAEGLTPLYTLVDSPDDWDRYEALQWRAVELYAVEHPHDPDVPELLARARRDRDAYLRWGRETLGWAIYLFRKGG